MRDKVLYICLGIAGTIWGLCIALGTLIVSGAGDGWTSPLPFGLLAIITTPLVTIAWVKRRTGGKQLARFCLVIALAANILLLFATLDEGVRYFINAFPYSIVWVTLWFSWQLLALVVMFYKPAGPNNEYLSEGGHT